MGSALNFTVRAQLGCQGVDACCLYEMAFKVEWGWVMDQFLV